MGGCAIGRRSLISASWHKLSGVAQRDNIKHSKTEAKHERS